MGTSMRRRMISCVAVMAMVLVGASCSTAGASMCSGTWCLLTDLGVSGDVVTVTSVTNAGQAMVSSRTGSFPAAVSSQLFLYAHPSLGTHQLISSGSATNLSDGTITPDGRWVAMYEGPPTPAGSQTVSLLDLQNSTMQVIATPATAVFDQFGQVAVAPYVSPDGQVVAWGQTGPDPTACGFLAICRDVWTWSVSNPTAGIAVAGDRLYPRSLDANGFFYGDPVCCSTTQLRYYEFSSATSSMPAPHAKPAPPNSSVDGRYWVGGTATSVTLTDESTSMTTDLGAPAGANLLSTNRWGAISGDGHHVVVSDGTSVWMRDV